MGEFRNILVPIDLSVRTERTLRVALALARAHRARVTLLHVVQTVPNIAPAELRDFYLQLTAKADRKLRAAARRFAARRVPVRTELCLGDPAEEIVRAAEKRRADLLVVGSHRVRPGRRATGWGTTSYKIGIFCRCPVLLIK